MFAVPQDRQDHQVPEYNPGGNPQLRFPDQMVLSPQQDLSQLFPTCWFLFLAPYVVPALGLIFHVQEMVWEGGLK